MLIEAAWNYQFTAGVESDHRLAAGKLPKPITDTAWKAQVRLCGRFKRLLASRGMKSKASSDNAIARELAGFVWAIACQLPRPTN